jgi:hypothetical protein
MGHHPAAVLDRDLKSRRRAREDADADHPDVGRRRMIEQSAIVLCRII